MFFIKYNKLFHKMSCSHPIISSIVSLYSNAFDVCSDFFFSLVPCNNKNNCKIVVKYYNNLSKIINSQMIFFDNQKV